MYPPNDKSYQNIFGGAPAATPQPGIIQQTNDEDTLKKILAMIGSTGGQTLIGAAGAGLQAYGQNQSESANREQSAGQFQANLLQRQSEQDRVLQHSNAASAEAASPLGGDQQYAQKMAVLKQLMGGARNFSATPGDPRVAAAMGTSFGGMRLPEGGFDPAMLERLYGDAATQGSIVQHSNNVMNIDPRAQHSNLGQLFGTPVDGTANPNDALMNTYQSSALQSQADAQAKQRELIQRALDGDITGEKQPKKTKKTKAKGALGGAASGALKGAALGSVVPGIGTGIGAAIGGGVGFFKGLV